MCIRSKQAKYTEVHSDHGLVHNGNNRKEWSEKSRDRLLVAEAWRGQWLSSAKKASVKLDKMIKSSHFKALKTHQK